MSIFSRIANRIIWNAGTVLFYWFHFTCYSFPFTLSMLLNLLPEFILIGERGLVFKSSNSRRLKILGTHKEHVSDRVEWQTWAWREVKKNARWIRMKDTLGGGILTFDLWPSVCVTQIFWAFKSNIQILMNNRFIQGLEGSCKRCVAHMSVCYLSNGYLPLYMLTVIWIFSYLAFDLTEESRNERV